MSFKYKNLPTFCFMCGKMGHGFQLCELLTNDEKDRPVDELSFSVALRDE